jgi:Na+/melibiose symporter-like transporter
MIKYIRSIFDYHEHKKQLLIIVLLSFLAAFSIARIYSLSVGYSIYISGYHIHHFYFGALIISIGGLLGILTSGRRKKQISAMFIGAGMGLFADEIGLLLNCTSNNRICAYAFPDSFDIIFAIALSIISVMVLTDFIDRRSMREKKRRDAIANKTDHPQQSDQNK